MCGSHACKRQVCSPSDSSAARGLKIATRRQRGYGMHAWRGVGCREMSTSSEETDKPAKPQGFIDKYFSREACIADEGFKNRWAMVVPAFMTQLCIGSPWAWSVLSGTISRELGVAGSAAADWSMAETTLPLSIVFAMQVWLPHHGQRKRPHQDL